MQCAHRRWEGGLGGRREVLISEAERGMVWFSLRITVLRRVRSPGRV